MAARPKCYLASPLGFDDAGRLYLRDVYVPALSELVDPVDPWMLVSVDEVEQARAAGESAALNARLGELNARAIDGCELLVAHLDGQEVDSGTASEVGYAVARGLCCFGLRTDFRRCGEEGSAVNLQLEWFIHSSGGTIARTLPDLIVALRGAL